MSKTILVVDDRALNREFLSMLLSVAGYRVVDAGDGAEALDVVRREKIDLIISDILMPVMDGIEFANRLRAEAAYTHIPLIFYTATYRATEVRKLAQSCDVATILAKPAEPQAILDAVSSALGISSHAAPDIESRGKYSTMAFPELAGLQYRLQTAIFGPNETNSKVEGNRAAEAIQALSLRTAALLELSMTLPLEREPQQLLELFCRAAQSIMSAKHLAIGMGESGQHTRFAMRGMSRADIEAIYDTLNPRTGPLHDKLFDGKLLRTQDVDCQSVLNGLPAFHPLRKNALLIPVVLRSRPYGWLYVAEKSADSVFSGEDEQFATILAAQLAPTYENLVLYDEVQQHAGELKLEIIERQRVADELQESETRFRQLAENIHQVFFLSDHRSLAMLYVSPAYEGIWGRSCLSLYASPLSWLDSVYPDDVSRALRGYTNRDAMGRFDVEYRILRPDGEIRAIRSRGFPIHNERGEIYRIAGISEDVTEKTAQTRRIARLSGLYAVLSGINSAIVRIHDRNELFQEACRVAVDHGEFSMAWIGIIDPDTLEGKVVAWYGGEAGYAENVRLTARAGTPDSNRPECVAAREMRPVVCNNVQADPTPGLHQSISVADGPYSVASWPLVIDNRVVAVMTLFAQEVDFFDTEQIKLLNELASDLSFGLQFIEKEEKLSYLALYDVLTALPNSTLFHDRLAQFLHVAKHDSKFATAIALNIQHFAHLNNAMGRHAGDAVLREVAARLTAALQEPYSLARISGDTFAVAISGLHHGTDIVSILEQQVFASFKQPFLVNGQEIRIAACAGLAMYPDDGENAETLFRHAEVALNKAKSSGQPFLYFAPQMNTAIAARLALENDLRIALECRQFVMYYQPRVDLRNGRIVSAEALIRWKHPQRGLVPPSEFIPLAEETGLIVPMGAWIIDNVCAQQAQWLGKGVNIVPVAVNLSAIQFQKGPLMETIRNSVEKHGLEKNFIEFELTESVVMNDPEEAARNLQMLKEMGIKLSLDDFGTGYSSLAYLKRFPFDFVKIDRAFIVDITRSPEDAAIATAVIAMAHNLNLRVIAEGVETEAQLNYLRKHRCDEIQGYYFSPPVPATEFETLLQQGKRLMLEREPATQADTLLIVDDEPHILKALTRALRTDSYNLLTASSGSEALELMAMNAIQVIISDQRMPNMSGAEFLGIARELYPDTVRIILSGYADMEMLMESVNRGAVSKFLIKPWNDDLLREHIRDAFRHYRPATENG
ncbi:EAL domain-containing protein [Undibacterium sp.]|jgi:diguanylate cyclase (GGDEF)-like protein/PAS domain S-box-containing protein|uniref:EAL domain-containing protein n=1 Tax=Undibacterium sp. TaxID=1914977 RepID=UPI002BDAA4D7|nr:EAL domain-containing protein [Undibacterium sp.]HTD03885.1 EAL domain-containing protein [Undibacterium sp.]